MSEPVSNDHGTSRRIFVCRLARFTKQKDLLKLWGPHGAEHAVLRVQPSGNVAFVTFNTPQQAARVASNALTQPIVLHKRKLRVMVADAWHGFRLPSSGSGPSTGLGSSWDNPFPGYEPVYSAHLPVEVVARIAAFLPFTDRARMERVSKTWRAGVQEAFRKMQHLDVNDWRWPGMQGWRRIKTEGFYWVLARCAPHLKSIVLDDELTAEDLRPQLLALVTKSCPALERLDVTAVEARPSAFRELAASVSSLSDLAIGRCTNCSDIELGKVLEVNKTLQEFSAKGTDFSGKSLLQLSRDLVKLNLRDCTARGEYIAAAISKFSKLSHLCLIRPKNFHPDILQGLIANPTLPRSMESMEFVGCNPWSGDGEPREEDAEAEQEEAADFFEFDLGPIEMAVSLPSRYPLVTELGVAFCGWVDNTFIGEVGRHMKHLIKLDITGCTNIRGQFSLETLSGLNHCTELQISLLYPDVGAQFLKDMSSLRELTCRDNRGIADEDVCGLIRNSATIMIIDLEGCIHVGRAFVECVYSALRGDPHNHRTQIRVGGTSAIPLRRDRQLLHVLLDYTRHSKCPYA